MAKPGRPKKNQNPWVKTSEIQDTLSDHEERIKQVESSASSMPIVQEKIGDYSEALENHTNEIDELKWKIAKLEDQIESLIQAKSDSANNSR